MMEQISVERVLSEFPMEQQHKETHPQPLVISDITQMMVSLKVTLTHGVRLVDLVVVYQRQIPMLMEQLQSVLDHLEKQHIVLLQYLHR